MTWRAYASGRLVAQPRPPRGHLRQRVLDQVLGAVVVPGQQDGGAQQRELAITRPARERRLVLRPHILRTPPVSERLGSEQGSHQVGEPARVRRVDVEVEAGLDELELADRPGSVPHHHVHARVGELGSPARRRPPPRPARRGRPARRRGRRRGCGRRTARAPGSRSRRPRPCRPGRRRGRRGRRPTSRRGPHRLHDRLDHPRRRGQSLEPLVADARRDHDADAARAGPRLDHDLAPPVQRRLQPARPASRRPAARSARTARPRRGRRGSPCPRSRRTRRRR